MEALNSQSIPETMPPPAAKKRFEYGCSVYARSSIVRPTALVAARSGGIESRAQAGHCNRPMLDNGTPVAVTPGAGSFVRE